jgi:uncharacterized protein DUF6544
MGTADDGAGPGVRAVPAGDQSDVPLSACRERSSPSEGAVQLSANDVRFGVAAMTAASQPTRFTASLLAGLAEPVRRYLSHAISEGTELGTGVSLTMTGRIKVGLWLPFSARQECDGRSFAWRARVGFGPLTALAVVDRFGQRGGSMDGRLLGRIRIFHAEDENTRRSAAGRAALEAVYTPASLLPQRGVNWRAESEGEIVASWDVPPERPELHLEIDDRGAVRAYWAARWGSTGQKAFGYIPCGCDVGAERRFGDLVVPSRITGAWWFGTPRQAPFYRAEIRGLAATR